MDRYAKLLVRFAAVSFRNLSEFRLDFVTSTVHNLIYQAIFIIFWGSIVRFTGGALGDWTFPKLAILSAFTLVATGLMQWFIGILHLPRKVIQGQLDKYLCRPASPLFALVAEEINVLASAQQLLSALLILVSVCAYFDVTIHPLGILLSFSLLILGASTVTLIQGSIGLLSFWLGDVERLQALFMISGEFERYPLTLFPVWLRTLLVWVLPIGLISTYPVLIFLGEREMALPYLLIALVLVATWTAIFHRLWSLALRRYESFGG